MNETPFRPAPQPIRQPSPVIQEQEASIAGEKVLVEVLESLNSISQACADSAYLNAIAARAFVKTEAERIRVESLVEAYTPVE